MRGLSGGPSCKGLQDEDKGGVLRHPATKVPGSGVGEIALVI
jgi:hypothetical protein